MIFMIKIQNKQEYYSAMASIEGYLQKGFSHLSLKEEQHLEELSRAAEAWELNKFPMPIQPSFINILNHIIQNLNINQSNLSERLGVSKSHLSEILSGKKQPNIELVASVYRVFGIDADLLLESVGFSSKDIPTPKSKHSDRSIKSRTHKASRTGKSKKVYR
jgi:antitoxin component HigA of HigAB toxin-antitoxin module